MRRATALLRAWQIEHVQLSGAITVSLSDRFIEDPAIDGPINARWNMTRWEIGTRYLFIYFRNKI